MDVHSAYTLFASKPHDTVKTVTNAATEICKAWNELYGKAPKASMFVLSQVNRVGSLSLSLSL